MTEQNTATTTNPHAHLKIIAGADPFGCQLKDTLVSHLRSLNIQVQDLGTDKYYSIASHIGRIISSSNNNNNSTSTPTTRGLLVCGTGVGVSIFANKFPGVYAATCTSVSDAINARSINNSNVLSLSGNSTSPDSAIEILTTFLNTPFKSPCPASGSQPWPEDIDYFLDNSVTEMATIGRDDDNHDCAICVLAKTVEFEEIGVMPGGEMKIVRESPTSAVVRFKGGSVEPAHHHSFGHDLVVLKGRKKVWNLSKEETFELGVGDYLFTPAGDVHRVKYFEDTEFFIKWDGKWDIFMDEDLPTAHASIDKSA